MNEASDGEPRGTGKERVFVWDAPVRLFHWALVALLIGLVITAEGLDDAIELHAKLGLATLALVLFRVAWGMVGGSYARFGQFLRGPRAVAAYARTLIDRKPHFVAGHNPLGGWMVVLLLTALTTQAILGLFANDDVLFDGPLAYLVSKETSDRLTGLHADLYHALLVLVGLHVVAVIAHKLVKGDNLVPAMFTGYKRLPQGVQARDGTAGGLLRAVVLLAACGGFVWWLGG